MEKQNAKATIVSASISSTDLPPPFCVFHIPCDLNRGQKVTGPFLEKYEMESSPGKWKDRGSNYSGSKIAFSSKLSGLQGCNSE